jgi:hypothetical protein
LRPLATLLTYDGEENLLESRFASFFAGDPCAQLVKGTLSN